MPETAEDQIQRTSKEDLDDIRQQCIFCQIVSGKVASKRVYEDDKLIAILDINPANPGHVLIMPKEHYPIVPLMPLPDVRQLFAVVKKISRAQIRSLGVEGTNIFVANGSVAGQKAPHIMVHSIPRKEGDGVTVFSLPKNQITPQDQEKLRVAIKRQVNKQFGINEPLEEEHVAEEKAEHEQEKAQQERPVQEQKEKPQEQARPAQQPAPQQPEKKGFNLDSISKLFK
ncbi:HIT domain-containing protein [Candidatus Woesearchaeota archaeon]|nr:HIT domain-containing protein [Candidatus Woesearchaeota archaeon]